MVSLMATLAFTSCQEEGSLVEGNYSLSLKAHYIAISPNEYNFSATQDYSSMGKVETMETPWAFTGMPDWLSVSPSSGDSDQEIAFTAQNNPSSENTRTSVFYLKSTDPEWEQQRKVSVSQTAATPYVKLLSDDNMLVMGNKGVYSVDIETNCTPTVSVSNYNSNWLSASLSSDKKKVKINVEENTTPWSRTGYVSINTSSGNGCTVTVMQNAAKFVSETTELNFDNTPASYKLSITSEASWTATTSTPWITVSPASGTAGTSSVEISVSPNTQTSDREGYVDFNIGGNQVVEVSIKQRGIYIDTGEELLDIASTGETRKLNVKSNTSWKVTSDSEWMTISPTEGNGKTEAMVTIADNPSLSERRGYLTFVSDAENITEKKLVRQQGKTFSVETTLLNFTDKAGSATVDIASDGTWNAEKQKAYDWFEITPITTNGTSKLQVTVQENYTTEERTGYINVSLYDKTYQIAVHQDSKYLNVKADALKFTSKGGKSEVEIATNDAWKATIGNAATWLSLDKNEGVGDCKFVVNIADNATIKARKTYVDVATNNAGSIRLNYEQAARYLNVDLSDFTFFAKGGTSELATITTDGIYQITQEGGWFQINKVSDNTFTITATANNTNTERNGSITISLTDLAEGELKVVLPVIQVKAGATFTKGEFTSDKKWNLSEGHDATITVIGFTADKSWNVNPSVSTSITFSGYQTDGDWNKRHNSSMDANTSGYGSDGNWNNNHKDNDNVSGSGYGSDSNWNNGHKDDGNVSGTGYGSDNNWNNGHKDDGNISGTGYGDDSNWNNQHNNNSNISGTAYGSEKNWNKQ